MTYKLEIKLILFMFGPDVFAFVFSKDIRTIVHLVDMIYLLYLCAYVPPVAGGGGVVG